MQSSETISGYRRMTPGERLELSLRMTEEQLPHLVEGAPEDVARRFTMLQRENDLRNHNMRVAMARTRQNS
jgi:hypothetical protein